MLLEHAMELLGNVVENTAIAENTATQIYILQDCYGFTNNDLLEFGYSERDVADYGEKE